MEMGVGREPVAVSVVIVNFNGGHLIDEAVQSVLRADVALEVFVCDNGSSDGSLQRLKHIARDTPNLEIIENHRNLGFARANNIAFELAAGELILLLNPDCVVGAGTIEHMVKVMATHPNVGLGGCLLRNPDGSEQAGCRRTLPTPWRSFVRICRLNSWFPHSRLFQTFILTGQPLSAEPVTVEAISGAFMVARRTAMEDVGLLDEGYFLHCEDLDWCMRFRQAGWEVLFVPQATATHHKGTCSKGRELRVAWYMHRGMARFYRKFFRDRYPFPLMMVVLLGVWVRFGAVAAKALLRAIPVRRRPKLGEIGGERPLPKVTAPRRLLRRLGKETVDVCRPSSIETRGTTSPVSRRH